MSPWRFLDVGARTTTEGVADIRGDGCHRSCGRITDLANGLSSISCSFAVAEYRRNLRLCIFLPSKSLAASRTNCSGDRLTSEVRLTADTLPDVRTNAHVWALQWFGCSALTLSLYTTFCVALACVAFLRPLPTYDRLLYAGAVASLRYSDPVILHHIARAEFDAEPSPFQFENVASDPYFLDVYNNPNHFVQQLGLSRVKLGYVAAGYILWRGGLPILVGLRLISACCLLIVGLTLLTWTHNAVLCFLVLLTPPVLNMGRMVTGDPMSTTVILLALFALAKQKPLLAAILLLASILVRSDNFVLVLILLVWMYWSGLIHAPFATICAVFAIATSALVNWTAGMFPYRVLMQHSFIRAETEPLAHPVPIDFAGYLHALAGLRAIPYTFMTVWLLVAAVAWKHLPKSSFFRRLFPVIGLYIVIRLLIFPNFDDRVFVWAYLAAGVGLIQTAQFPLANPEPNCP